MSTLHTVNKAPSQNILARCLSLVMPGDALLLIEDGVYCADLLLIEKTKALSLSVYVLEEDMRARGVSLPLNNAMIATDTTGFVKLCTTHNKVINWF